MYSVLRPHNYAKLQTLTALYTMRCPEVSVFPPSALNEEHSNTPSQIALEFVVSSVIVQMSARWKNLHVKQFKLHKDHIQPVHQHPALFTAFLQHQPWSFSPKSSHFEAKFVAAMTFHFISDIPMWVMKDTRDKLRACMVSVLSKVGEFCLPGRFVFSQGTHGPVRDGSCST